MFLPMVGKRSTLGFQHNAIEEICNRHSSGEDLMRILRSLLKRFFVLLLWYEWSIVCLQACPLSPWLPGLLCTPFITWPLAADIRVSRTLSQLGLTWNIRLSTGEDLFSAPEILKLQSWPSATPPTHPSPTPWGGPAQSRLTPAPSHRLEMSSIGLTTLSLPSVRFTYREESFELRLPGGKDFMRQGKQFPFFTGDTSDLRDQSSDPAQFWADIQKRKVRNKRLRGKKGIKILFPYRFS